MPGLFDDTDPWAWRSNMDAPKPGKIEQALLKQGPAPTGHDRIFDMAYGFLGNLPENRLKASALANLFDVGTLGMATGAYDGGRELAETGRPSALAMALIPGAKVAQPLGKASQYVGGAIEKALASASDHGILSRANEAGYFPPNKAQRPFENDYRKAPEGDPGSPLQRDIDGRPLTAKLIAGRRTVGGPDEGLGDAEIRALAEWAATRVDEVPRSELPRRAVGSYQPLGGITRVAKDLSPEDKTIALAHETGHALDTWNHKADIKKYEKAAREVFSDLATGQPQVIPAKRTGPEAYGYAKKDITSELFAEALRAYVQNPNYLKSVSPELAKELRKLNDVKGLNKILQLNSPLAGLGLGAAALWPNEGDSQ